MWFLVCLLTCAIGNRAVSSVSYADREDITRMEITEGDTLSLICQAKPSLLRSYRWVYMRDGVRKPRVLSSGRRLVVGEPRLSIEAQPGPDYVNLVLNLQEIRPYEQGLFMCWRQGLKPDPQVYVRVLEAGAEEAEPISVEISAPSHVNYGGAVTIKCLISPSWPGKIFWTKNGNAISQADKFYSQKVEDSSDGEQIASLDITSVRESANYTCQVPSNPPTEASFYLAVKVARIESVTTEPHKDEVQYGEELRISCVTSEADSEILWLKDGANLDENSEVSGIRKLDEVTSNRKMKSDLVFQSFGRQNNGQYVCYVPGNSKSVVINIEGRPPRIIGVKSWDFVMGEVLNLVCSTQYNKNKNDVTWLFEGEPLRPDWYGETKIREDARNITHYDLSLPIPTGKHAGTYTCTSQFGSASTTVREIVPPYIVGAPEERSEVSEGESLSLSCSAVGYPIPIILWEKYIDGHWKLVEEAMSEEVQEVQGVAVKVVPVSEKRKGGEEKVGEKGTLVIKDVQPYHGGDYRCRGSNERHEAISKAQVIIKDPPPVIVSLMSAKVIEGGDLVITCVVKNLLEPVQFVKEFKVLGQGDDPRIVVNLLLNETEDDEPREREEHTTAYELVISNAELEDSGTYECLASSDITSSVEAVVLEASPTIVEVAASPAVEGGEFFVSCTIRNLYTDNRQVVFYFDGANLNEAGDPRYSTHLAELKGESVVNSRPRAKQATYVLKVSKTIPEDSGQYRCVLDDDAVGSVLVDVEAIENIEEVHLEASPTWVGGELKLRCSVTNWNGEVSFFQNTTMLLEEEDPRYYLSRRVDGNTTIQSLTIFDVTPQDSGFYQCFTSPFTSADVNVTIKSLENLKITLEHLSDTSLVWPGSEMVLDCSVYGFMDYMHTIELSHNGRPYLYVEASEKGAQVNSRVTFIRDSEGHSPKKDAHLSYKIKLREVEDKDAGSWVCRATVPEAAVVLEDTKLVQVFKLPEFVELPEREINVEENANLFLDCRATGFPQPHVLWYKGDLIVPIVNETESAKLHIPSFTEVDVGTYRCDATSFNETVSFETNLHLIRTTTTEIVPLTSMKQEITEERLQIIEMPDKEVFVPENSSIDLKCVASGSSPPIVTWFKKGSEEILASGHDYAIYTIENFNEVDAGNYICKASLSTTTKTSDSSELILVKIANVPVCKEAPDIWAEPGSQVTATCTVDSPLTTNIHFSWVWMTATYSRRVAAMVPSEGLTSNLSFVIPQDILSLSQLGPNNKLGSLECWARNEVGRQVTPCSINVRRPGTSGPVTEPPTTTTQFSLEAVPTLPLFTLPSSLPTLMPEKLIYISGPSQVKIGTDLTIMCLVSPMLANFKYLIMLNEVMLTLDKHLITSDPRMGISTGFGPKGETIVGLTIRNVRDSDSGEYKCTANTDPIAYNSHVVEVVSELRVTEQTPTEETFVKEPEQQTEISVSGSAGDFWDSTPPFIFRGITAPSRPEPEAEIATTQFEDYSLDNDVKGPTSSEQVKKAVVGEKISFTCTSYVSNPDIDPKYFWYFETPEKLLFADSDRLTPDERFHVKANNVLDEFVSSLFISKVQLKDAGIYGCSLGLSQNFTYEHQLKVIEVDEAVTNEVPVTFVDKEDDTEEGDDGQEGEEPEHEGEHDEMDYKSKSEEEYDEDGVLIVKEEERGKDSKEIVEGSQTPTPELEDKKIEDKESDDIEILKKQLIEEEKKKEKKDFIELEGTTERISFTSTLSSSDDDVATTSTASTALTTQDAIEGLLEPGTESRPTNDSTHISDDDKGTKETTDHFDESFTDSPLVVDVSDASDDLETTTVVNESPDSDKSIEVSSDEVTEGDDEVTESDDEVTESDDEETEDLEEDVEKKEEVITTKEIEYQYTTLSTEEFPTTEPPASSNIIIIATPGEDVLSPAGAEVVLTCPTEAVSEDITWKDDQNLLFLGSLDLAGVEGLALTSEGKLRLLPKVAKTKDGKTYTCLVFDYNTYEDVPVMSYLVELTTGDPTVKPGLEQSATTTNQPPTSTYEFPGLEWQEVAVIANSEMAGKSLVKVLKEGGIKAQLASADICTKSVNINDWEKAQQILKECESDSRSTNAVKSGQSVFVILDFTVRLPSGKHYGSTLISIHNVARDIKSHVYGPLIPMSEDERDILVECGSPVYSSQSLGLDMADICKNSIASTILSLQEAYLSQSRKHSMV